MVETEFRFTSGNGSEGSGEVRGAFLQPDGKIFLYGNYQALNDEVLFNLTRFNRDGTSDLGFPILGTSNPGGVYSSAVLSDGRIIVGTQVRFRRPTDHIAPYARVFPDGREDTSFVGPLTDIVLVNRSLPDGKLLIGGNFRNADKPRYLMRLTETGAVDRTFQGRVDGDNSQVNTMAIQEDGKIVLGGTFTMVGGVRRNAVARVHADGRLDTTFQPNFAANTAVQALALQSDGRILVGEGYRNTAGGLQTRLVRLNPDGTRDSAFGVAVESNEFASQVFSLVVQADGSTLIGGEFLTVNGVPRRGLARVDPDGSVDSRFASPLTDGSLAGLTLEPDGRLLAAGLFRIENGPTLYSLVRLQNDPASQELTVVSTRRVEWKRGGTSPETHQVWFEVSEDAGSTWAHLGYGTRGAGGWSLGGLSLPRSARLRARAITYTGVRNGSQSLIETVVTYATAPEIAVYAGATTDAPPLTAGQTEVIDFGEARLGTPVTRNFTVANAGTAPLRVDRLIAPEGFLWHAIPAVPFEIDPGDAMVLEARQEAAALGRFSGTMTIGSDDVDEADFSFPVAAIVTAPEIAVFAGSTTNAPELTSAQPDPLDFGRQIQGTPGVQALTLSNTGTAPLKLTGISTPSGYVTTMTSALPQVLAPGQSTLVEVRLVSEVVGRHPGVFAIESDDLDESLFTFPVTGEVFIPPPALTRPAPEDAADTTLNRQTGLREQSVRLSNATTARVPAFMILVRGLPAEVTLSNASESLGDGTYAVLVRQPLEPFSTIDLVLEYATVGRRPLSSVPEFSIEVVLDAPDNTADPVAGAFAIEKLVWLPESAGLLLEFESEPGRLYGVHYSEDGIHWLVVPGAIRSAGNRTQWIDRGPPRTSSPPSSQASRYYRVFTMDE